jgi:hypothetical protein
MRPPPEPSPAMIRFPPENLATPLIPDGPVNESLVTGLHSWPSDDS